MPTKFSFPHGVLCAALGFAVSSGPGLAAQDDAALDVAEQHALCARTLAVAAEQARAGGREQLGDTYARLGAQDTERALTGGADPQMFSTVALDAVRGQMDRDPLDFLAVLQLCLERHGMILQREAEKERFPDWPQAPRQGYTLQPGDLEVEAR